MKVIRFNDGRPVGLELTRRNLEALLLKIDNPESARTLAKDEFFVTAVENEEHYADRPAGLMAEDFDGLLTRPETGVA